MLIDIDWAAKVPETRSEAPHSLTTRLARHPAQGNELPESQAHGLDHPADWRFADARERIPRQGRDG